MASRISEAFIGPEAPAIGLAAVTPSDVTVFTRVPKALYIGSSGDVSVVMADGTTGTFAGVPTGAVLPIQVQQVRNSGTTASSILALF